MGTRMHIKPAGNQGIKQPEAMQSVINIDYLGVLEPSVTRQLLTKKPRPMVQLSGWDKSSFPWRVGWRELIDESLVDKPEISIAQAMQQMYWLRS